MKSSKAVSKEKKEDFFSRLFGDYDFQRDVGVNVFSAIIISGLAFSAGKIPWVMNQLRSFAVEIQTASYDPGIVRPLMEQAVKNNDPRKAILLSRDVVDLTTNSDFHKILELRASAEKQLNPTGGSGNATIVAAMDLNRGKEIGEV